MRIKAMALNNYLVEQCGMERQFMKQVTSPQLKHLSLPTHEDWTVSLLYAIWRPVADARLSNTSQVKTYLGNHRKTMQGMLLGVSSYGAVVTRIHNSLAADVVFASPLATLDTFANIGFTIDVGT
jgi:hypothetical protein